MNIKWSKKVFSKVAGQPNFELSDLAEMTERVKTYKKVCAEKRRGQKKKGRSRRTGSFSSSTQTKQPNPKH